MLGVHIGDPNKESFEPCNRRGRLLALQLGAKYLIADEFVQRRAAHCVEVALQDDKFAQQCAAARK